MREVGELGQHERGALVLGQLGDVAEQGAQVRPLLDGGAEAVDGRLGVLGGHGLGPAGREHREAAVAGDRVQPWAHLVRAAARDQRPVRAQEGLLEGVLGFLGGAEHVPAEAQQRTVVAVVEGLEGALVAARGECRQPDVVHPGEPETGKLGNSECGGRHLEVITHIPDDPPMERRLASWATTGAPIQGGVLTTEQTKWRRPLAFGAAVRWVVLATPLHVFASVYVFHDTPAPGVVAAVVVACLLVLPYAPLRQSLRADPELRYLWREADLIATAGLVAPRVGEWLPAIACCRCSR